MQEAKEKLLEIVDLAYEVSKSEDYNVFVDFYGSVDDVDVRIDMRRKPLCNKSGCVLLKGNYNYLNTHERIYMKSAHLDNDRILDGIIEKLEELKEVD